MASNLAHGLFAMIVQAAIAKLAGLPFISVGIFAAALMAMLIDLDELENEGSKRTPLGHSVLFYFVWTFVVGYVLYLFIRVDVLSAKLGMELTLALTSAFASHMFVDLFTEEGIYLHPKRLDPGIWLCPTLDGRSGAWPGWYRVKLPRTWDNDSQLLNSVVSLGSLVMLIVYVGLTPLD